MKTSLHLPAFLRKRGVALILVVSVLSLLTILMLAMFTATDNEFKSTQGYVAAQDSLRFGNTAVNIVIAQLQQASVPTVGSTARVITATQPGEVRMYDTSGAFKGANKLYSSHEMQVTSTGSASDEKNLLTTDLPPANWDTLPDRYADLNEPIIRAAVGGSALAAELYFPIVDPRAYQGTQAQAASTPPGQVNVEGFSYTNSAAATGSSTSDGVQTTGAVIDGIVLPPSGGGNINSANAQRLPMPVEWIYVLQDGSLGSLDSANTYVKAPGSSSPASDNPIVGRVAFWTDDETSKININTASEPTFWATPRFFHEREHQWVDKPPTAKEYQRFPGHPATVALSSVLYPDVPGVNSFDLFGQTAALQAQNLDKMRRIYDIVPKISRGGSDGGTQVFALDDQAGYTQAKQVDVSSSINERLYASLDEMLFSPDASGVGLRVLNDNWVPPGLTGVTAKPIVDKSVYGRDLRETLERSRFFLTATSRGPDFNIMGTPKIAMWPISYYNDNDHRTVYDKLIAFCSTLKGSSDNSYYFQRAKAHDATYDISLQRNTQLMNYLRAMVNKPMPATSGDPSPGAAASLSAKYGTTGDNMNTVLVQIFDYIRSTDLYDDVLAHKNARTSTTNLSETQTYTNAPAEFYTYTNPLRYNVRTADAGGNALSKQMTVGDDGWPGHGTVSPSIWNVNGSKYRGMARMFTISEIGLHFICTADGGSGSPDSSPVKSSDSHSYVEPISGNVSGGRGADRIDPNDLDHYNNQGKTTSYGYLTGGDQTAYWWSNYPPKPAPDQYGTKRAKYLLPTTDNPNRHPGYDPANWNCTLEAGTPLPPKAKRIQALLDFEMFCPAEGWTLLNPEWTLVLDGNYINNITVNGAAVWSTSRNVVLKSNKNLFSVNNNMGRSGGSVDPVAVYSNRRCNAIGNMPKDPSYDASAQSGAHTALDNCDLASNFFTVAGGSATTMSIKFPAASGMKISLYDTHDWQNATPIQTMMVNLGAGGNITVPTPELVTVNTNKKTVYNGGVPTIYRATDAPHWWSFSYGGCLGRYQRSGTITPSNISNWGYAAPTPEASLQDRLSGRFKLQGDSSDVQSKEGPLYLPNNPAVPAAAALIFGLPSPFAGGKAKDGTPYEKIYGTDVVRSVIPALGDYRLLACRYDVPTSMWMPHRLWNATDPATGTFYYQAHNFCSHATLDAGGDANLNTSNQPNAPQFIRAYPNSSATLISMGTPGTTSRMPDIPQDAPASTGGNSPALASLNSFLDYDNGPGDSRDGAYCNKPDEGNFSALNSLFSGVGDRMYRNGYFYNTWESAGDQSNDGTINKDTYFTPNRIISSPVMFGSLVTGAFDASSPSFNVAGYPSSGAGRPWQTLLFRPHVQPCLAGPSSASFSGTTQAVPGGMSSHPGAQNPPDHYLLDLFNMPVVEPYAISEPLSTAGKINLNYQIVPFTYIRRATAVYAAMKGELMRAVSLSDNGNKANPNTTAYTYKNAATLPTGQTFPPVAFWTETGASVPVDNGHYWHRRIDPAETSKQLDERFSMNSTIPAKRQGLLRSASQVCELHMIPSNPAPVPSGMYAMPTSTVNNRETNMQKFWSVHALTGDNSREEIYSRLYPKFTTRSNTFRVHVRAQSIKKARSTAATTFSSTAGDKVLSEYRGSYLLERYIDPNDATNALPNYAAATDSLTLPSLETFYRFHILEVKRFSP